MPSPALMREPRKAGPGLSSTISTLEPAGSGWGWEHRRVKPGAAEKADATLRESPSEEESYDPNSQGIPRLMEEIGSFLFAEL